MMILPLTLAAASLGFVWVGLQAAALWLVASLTFIALNQALCRSKWFHSAPDQLGVCVLIGFTFVYTLVYGALPMLMIAQGGQGAIITGMVIIGGMVLSSTGEFVISRSIGAASMAPLFLDAVAGMVWLHKGMSGLQLSVVLIGTVALFAYLVEHALQRRKVERSLADALALARQKADEAAAANAAKTTFLATMSHEIRTPLNGVLGMAQVMEMEGVTDKQRSRLSVIQQSGASLMALLNDLLDLAKIEAGKMECESIPFSMDDLINAACAAYEPLAASKSLEFQVEFAPAASGVYLGDPTRVRQIINNLVSNALKFTSVGRIRLVVGRKDGALSLAVSDTGVGIAHDQMAKLFKAFTQVDESITRTHGGTGLGLAICKQLCTLMDGDISVQSTPGQGSTFTATLPLPRQNAHQVEAPCTVA